jgi:hypothetical protein
MSRACLQRHSNLRPGKSQRAIGKPQTYGSRILDRKAADYIRRKSLNCGYLAAQRAQVSNLVDHIDQDRTTPRLAAPRAVIEITIGLAEHFGTDHCDQTPKAAATHNGYGLFHDRVVLTMMSGQQSDVGALRGFAQPLPGID